eukprot:CAMPEP_0170638352 /NCGR_PEP_ID=MMETSP0224-20130122/38982_1 /TAXON_ID=285029 /ORGANISM="Togula jolla, Strain CCCM 725" /LENGTH=132 /DNA_ID=CAMNT_0010968459 /DNA_START=392 /DNA_END=791 /DNA_ORIENTATION=+
MPMAARTGDLAELGQAEEVKHRPSQEVVLFQQARVVRHFNRVNQCLSTAQQVKEPDSMGAGYYLVHHPMHDEGRGPDHQSMELVGKHLWDEARDEAPHAVARRRTDRQEGGNENEPGHLLLRRQNRGEARAH